MKYFNILLLVFLLGCVEVKNVPIPKELSPITNYSTEASPKEVFSYLSRTLSNKKIVIESENKNTLEIWTKEFSLIANAKTSIEPINSSTFVVLDSYSKGKHVAIPDTVIGKIYIKIIPGKPLSVIQVKMTCTKAVGKLGKKTVVFDTKSTGNLEKFIAKDFL